EEHRARLGCRIGAAFPVKRECQGCERHRGCRTEVPREALRADRIAQGRKGRDDGAADEKPDEKLHGGAEAMSAERPPASGGAAPWPGRLATGLDLSPCLGGSFDREDGVFPAAQLVVVDEEVLQLLLELLAEVVHVPDVRIAVVAGLDAHQAVVTLLVLLAPLA